MPLKKSVLEFRKEMRHLEKELSHPRKMPAEKEIYLIEKKLDEEKKRRVLAIKKAWKNKKKIVEKRKKTLAERKRAQRMKEEARKLAIEKMNERRRRKLAEQRAFQEEREKLAMKVKVLSMKEEMKKKEHSIKMREKRKAKRVLFAEKERLLEQRENILEEEQKRIEKKKEELAKIAALEMRNLSEMRDIIAGTESPPQAVAPSPPQQQPVQEASPSPVQEKKEKPKVHRKKIKHEENKVPSPPEAESPVKKKKTPPLHRRLEAPPKPIHLKKEIPSPTFLENIKSKLNIFEKISNAVHSTKEDEKAPPKKMDRLKKLAFRKLDEIEKEHLSPKTLSQISIVFRVYIDKKLKIKRYLTHEELAFAVKEKKLKPQIKDQITQFSSDLTTLEYTNQDLDQETMNALIKELKEIILIL